MLQRLLVATLPLVPTIIMRRLSAKYIAGEALEDALLRLEALGRAGYPGVIDLLGEEVSEDAAADAAAQEYIRAAEGLAERSIDAYVSIKPTHLGLTLDSDRCLARYREVAERCQQLNQRLRVEMEDTRFTDETLSLYERLKSSHPNCGIVVQARLFRTLDDIAALSEGEHDVRLVKGIYLEPAEIAHIEPAAISDAYMSCAEALLARGATVSFATHDEHLVRRLGEVIESADAASRCELQVLDGVRASFWRGWRDGAADVPGQPLRVYVPYGPDWRAYSIRRMRKNPQMFRAVTKSLFFGD